MLLVATLATALAACPPTGASADDLVARRGATLATVVTSTLSSKTDQDGTRFELVAKDGIFHRNAPALRDAVVEGHLENVTPAGPTHKATMNVVLDDIRLAGGRTEPIDATLESAKTFEPHTHHVRDAGLVVGGAIVGHAFASRRGVRHGGLVGAAGGFALASRLKSDVVVRRGTVVLLRLRRDLL